MLRNHPVLGHARYLLERIRPELQQYFVERNFDGRPFDPDVRSIVQSSTSGPRAPPPTLSANAVLALNQGAAAGDFAHDTGEGGLSEYHLRAGGDLVWEIGTGYFGCRTRDGEFAEKASGDSVRCVSLKLSQGAKPGVGGVRPGAKVNAEIALGTAPDFIVDGAEGGTGAAPLEFADHVGTPRLIQDADYGNTARAMIFAIRCIQAQRCRVGAAPPEAPPSTAHSRSWPPWESPTPDNCSLSRPPTGRPPTPTTSRSDHAVRGVNVSRGATS